MFDGYVFSSRSQCEHQFPEISMFDFDEIAEAECSLPFSEQPLGFLQDVGFRHAPTCSGCAEVVPEG